MASQQQPDNLADATRFDEDKLLVQTVFPEDEDFGEVSQEPVDLHPTEVTE